MKNSTTSVALNTAMASAATVLNGPRSKNATCQVRYVQQHQHREDRVVESASGRCVGSCSVHVPADQIEQREQEDPDDVDEVPVEAADLDRAGVLGVMVPFHATTASPA